MLELMSQVNLQIPDTENCSNKPVLLHLEKKTGDSIISV